MLRPFTVLLSAVFLLSGLSRADEYFSLFNGKDLKGWDGDPTLWKVVDGIITGTCTGPGTPAQNSFLIWRGDARHGGTLKDFELRVVMRVIGDNNSGVQYRSRPLPKVGPWAIAGYQCDVHPAIEHTGMTYEEKGRGIFGLNGKSVLLDPEGRRWLVGEHEPLVVNVAEWNTYTVSARGNHLEHRINGKLSSQLTDHDETGRALEGLLAFQLHSGNAHTVAIREVKLRVIEGAEIVPFLLPDKATKIEKPKTSNPQGVGKPAPAKKP